MTMNDLERYRRKVIEEFQQNRAAILAQAQAIDTRVLAVELTGSVLHAEEFSEESDIDLAFEAEEGNIEEMEQMAEALRGKIGIGGGMADVVMTGREKTLE